MTYKEQIENRVYEYVCAHNMICEQDRIVAGVSGGADSVCLFFLLLYLQKKIPFWFCVVHVNHNIRGQEAIRDQEYTRKLCVENDIPFFVFSMEVEQMAVQEKLTLEEAGRKARYQAFDDCARQNGANKIVLAHHQNDQAETMIHHLARGTGLAGLCSLKPIRENKIRPLLCMERREIEHYLEESHISYLTDSTNMELEYTRNKIRHKVVDYLEKQVNPKTVQHMAQTAEMMEQIQAYLCQQTEIVWKRYVTYIENGISIDLQMQEEAVILQKYVYQKALKLLCENVTNITEEHLNRLVDLSGKQVGKKIELPEAVCAKRGYASVFLAKAEEKNGVGEKYFSKKDQNLVRTKQEEIWVMLEAPYKILENLQEKQIAVSEIPYKIELENCNIEFSLKEDANYKIPEKRYTKWLDYDKIKDGLTIRNRRSGDYIVVNSFGGRKKIKDYFIDQKIEKELRDDVLLLASGSEILWVIGWRISEFYKVSKDTKELLEIHVAGGKNDGR